MTKSQKKLQYFKEEDRSKLNSLELLIKIGRVSDAEGKFILEGRYSGSLAPNYLLNGKAVLAELKMFKEYPNYIEETISKENDFHLVHQYKLEGTLSLKGRTIYKNIVNEFKKSSI